MGICEVARVRGRGVVAEHRRAGTEPQDLLGGWRRRCRRQVATEDVRGHPALDERGLEGALRPGSPVHLAREERGAQAERGDGVRDGSGEELGEQQDRDDRGIDVVGDPGGPGDRVGLAALDPPQRAVATVGDEQPVATSHLGAGALGEDGPGRGDVGDPLRTGPPRPHGAQPRVGLEGLHGLEVDHLLTGAGDRGDPRTDGDRHDLGGAVGVLEGEGQPGLGRLARAQLVVEQPGQGAHGPTLHSGAEVRLVGDPLRGEGQHVAGDRPGVEQRHRGVVGRPGVEVAEVPALPPDGQVHVAEERPVRPAPVGDLRQAGRLVRQSAGSRLVAHAPPSVVSTTRPRSGKVGSFARTGIS